MIWFFRFLLLGFAVFGMVLVWKGWQLRRLSPAVLRTWTETTGVVVDVRHRNSVGTDNVRVRPNYFHKLEYVDPSERPHHVWTEVPLREELPRGAVLPLRYSPDDPSKATTLDPEAGGGTASGWGIVAGGSVFLLIGGYGSVLTWV